jgi:hypothetical protein
MLRPESKGDLLGGLRPLSAEKRTYNVRLFYFVFDLFQNSLRNLHNTDIFIDY